MRLRHLLFFFFIYSAVHGNTNDSVFVLKGLPISTGENAADPGLPLNKHWKYKYGDNPLWALPETADSAWDFANPQKFGEGSSGKIQEKIAWYRLRLDIDSSLIGKTLGLLVTQRGASEIYLDGKLIHKFGKVANNALTEIRRDPKDVPVAFSFDSGTSHVIAVRYSNNHSSGKPGGPNSGGGFVMKIADLNSAIAYKVIGSNTMTSIFMFYFSFFFALSLLHFVFFMFYRKEKSNLYYSIFAGGLAVVFLNLVVYFNFFIPEFYEGFGKVGSMMGYFYMPALLAMLSSIYYKKVMKGILGIISLYLIGFIADISGFEIPYDDQALLSLFALTSVVMVIAGIVQKKDGSWIIGTGVLVTILFFSILIVFAIASDGVIFTGQGVSPVLSMLFGILTIYATISIPFSMTIYLARQFSRTSKSLTKKLEEVEKLSKITIEQEKEKQKILESQKEVLEAQVTERTAEIVEQKKIIEEKNKDITDSITYAKRIQGSMLPREDFIRTLFPDSFIFYRPKDIVSGDFYWFGEVNGTKIVVSADCTGHGVPGALMSMIGSNLLSQLILEKGITKPSEILEGLDAGVAGALRQKQETEGDGIGLVRDGMDVGIVAVDVTNKKISFAGAQRPAWFIKNGALSEVKGDKVSIGGSKHEFFTGFTNNDIDLTSADFIFLSSDGFADQFGGTDGKKLMTKEFKKLLEGYSMKGLSYTRTRIEQDFDSWRGNREQVDDVLVIGIRV